jgi:phage gp36-like protein
MQYLTSGELDAYLPGDVKNRATPTQKDDAIGAASRQADTYLRSAGYTVPFAEGSWDEALEKHVAYIAAYDLATRLGLTPEHVKESSLYLNYKTAIEWFEGIVAGKVSLNIDLPAPSSGTGRPRVASKTARGW